MPVSNKKLLSWATLIQAMKQALDEEWGVKVQVFSPPNRLKAAFYELRKEFSPEFDGLSLLSTPHEGEYLIYHPGKGNSNGEREDRMG